MRYYIAKNAAGEIVATRTAATKQYSHAVVSHGVWKRHDRADQPWKEANWASNARLANAVHMSASKRATMVNTHPAIEVDAKTYRDAVRYLKSKEPVHNQA